MFLSYQDPAPTPHAHSSGAFDHPTFLWPRRLRGPDPVRSGSPNLQFPLGEALVRAPPALAVLKRREARGARRGGKRLRGAREVGRCLKVDGVCMVLPMLHGRVLFLGGGMGGNYGTTSASASTVFRPFLILDLMEPRCPVSSASPSALG